MERLGQYERHIQYLYEAARAGTMRAASERLNVATSSISRQIAFLEAELGTPLLERGRRSIKLTEAGELLVQYYREKLAHDEAFVSELQELRGNRSGHVKLAVGEGLISEMFSSVLHKFTEGNPNIRLSIETAGTNEVMRLVREDEAHIGMTFQSPPDPKIRPVLALPQPLVVVVHPDDPLARMPALRLPDLRSYRIGLPARSFRIRQLLETLDPHMDNVVSPILSTNSLALLKQFAKSRQGITILTKIVVADELTKGELAAIPLDHAQLQSTKLQIITRLGRLLPVAASQLLKTLEAALRSL